MQVIEERLRSSKKRVCARSLRLVWNLKSRRIVVEVRDDLHREIGKLALLNDPRIYELINAIIEEALKNQQKIRTLVKRLKL